MIYHAFTSYVPTDKDTARRHAAAQESWKSQPWVEIPIADSQLPRLWREEGKSRPYIRDMFDYACNGKPDDDILIYTNCDIHVRSDTSMVIACTLQEMDGCYAYRCDFRRLDKTPPDSEFCRGQHYAGSDLFAFRTGWWMKYRQSFPDMLVGIEAWDPCLRLLIDKTNPNRATVLNDIICHERHASFWENSANRYRFKGQRYNLALAKVFLSAHGVNPRTHGIP